MSSRFDEIDNDIKNLLKQIHSLAEKVEYDNLNLHNGLNMIYFNLENLRKSFYEDMGRDGILQGKKVVEKLEDEGKLKGESEIAIGGPQYESEEPRQGE